MSTCRDRETSRYIFIHISIGEFDEHQNGEMSNRVRDCRKFLFHEIMVVVEQFLPLDQPSCPTTYHCIFQKPFAHYHLYLILSQVRNLSNLGIIAAKNFERTTISQPFAGTRWLTHPQALAGRQLQDEP